MAKAKAKPAVMRNWTVNANGQEIAVAAERMDITASGTLIFVNGSDFHRVWAPGAWTTVTRVEPEPAV